MPTKGPARCPEPSGKGGSPADNRRGFTLVELLLVMIIAACLIRIVLPVVFSITSASRVTEAASGICSAVERARSEAVNRRTYVWLALQTETNNQLMAVRVGIVASGDGTTNTNASNLVPLGKTTLYKGVGFADAAATTLRIPGTNQVMLPDCSQGLNFSVGAVSFVQGRSITFLPLGEATTNPVPAGTNGFDPEIVIPLREAQGRNLFAGNDAAVVIDGSVGIPIVYRQ